MRLKYFAEWSNRTRSSLKICPNVRFPDHFARLKMSDDQHQFPRRIKIQIGLIPNPEFGFIDLQPRAEIAFYHPWDGDYYT